MAGYVSEAVIKRLPAYYRHLRELETEGVKQISSQGLGERMRLTASQIRQDINCFGGFGRQGYGYSVSGLREHIGRILGVDHVHRMIIVGGGNIGRAVALSDSFPANGFETVAIFDSDEKKIGMTPAVEISYLKPEEQQMLLTAIDSEQATPSLSQAQRMKKLSRDGKLNDDTMLDIMMEQKKPEGYNVVLSADKLRKYFPRSYTPQKMEETILKLLDAWLRKRQRDQSR